jgi:hypothetical protein
MSTHLAQSTPYANAPELTASAPAAIWEPVPAPTVERAQVQGATHGRDHDLGGSTDTPTLLQISERFGASLTLSSILGFCGISVIAHGSAIDSVVAISFGAVALVIAAVIQWRERRRALSALVERGRSHGLKEAVARVEAKAILRKWLL